MCSERFMCLEWSKSVQKRLNEVGVKSHTFHTLVFYVVPPIRCAIAASLLLTMV